MLNSFIWNAARFRPSKRDTIVKKNGKWIASYYKKYISENGYWSLLDSK